MTAHPLRDFQPIPTRPGQHARDLIATEHGVTPATPERSIPPSGGGP
jgi:hypothetical protein